MSQHPWFNYEESLNERQNPFIPLDVESPIHHHRLTDDPFDDHLRSRDTSKNVIESQRYGEGESRKAENAEVKEGHQLISITMAKVRNRSRVQRGRERETTNLSKFMFSAIKRVLDANFLTRRLGLKEVQALKEFKREKGRLDSYENLLKFQSIKTIIKGELQSSQFVRNILISKKMAVQNKIIVLKFLENIRCICYSSVKRWKFN